MNSAEELWNRVMDMLKTDLTSTAIDTWFNDCKALDVTDNILILSTPADFKKMLLKTVFFPLSRTLFVKSFPENLRFRF